MIQQDKIKHFIAGASALLGISKEVYDSRGHGTAEVADAVATAVGGVVGAVLMRVVIVCQ